MRKYFYIMLVALLNANCKAQVINPINIVPIQNQESLNNINENDYLKDTNS